MFWSSASLSGALSESLNSLSEKCGAHIYISAELQLTVVRLT